MFASSFRIRRQEQVLAILAVSTDLLELHNRCLSVLIIRARTSGGGSLEASCFNVGLTGSWNPSFPSEKLVLLPSPLRWTNLIPLRRFDMANRNTPTGSRESKLFSEQRSGTN